MFRKTLWLAAIALIVLPAATAQAQFQTGDWDLTLTGSGSSSDDFDNTALTAGGGIGYFFIDPMEVGLRQSISYANVEDGGDAFAGSTRIFTDYHFDLGAWQPFVGASAGYTYGDDIDDKWIAGLEGGVKYFVNSTTYVYGIFGWDFSLEDSIDDGNWVYGAGIGFKF